MKKTAEILTTMVNEEADKLGVFVVGHSQGLQGLYRYYVDSSGALNMQTITELSRAVSARIDAMDLEDVPFTFEISSPGADKPLSDIRQFPKHTGRNFKVELENGEVLDGVLNTVEGNELVFEKKTIEKENGKKIEMTETVRIPLDKIKSATIKLVFK